MSDEFICAPSSPSYISEVDLKVINEQYNSSEEKVGQKPDLFNADKTAKLVQAIQSKPGDCPEGE